MPRSEHTRSEHAHCGKPPVPSIAPEPGRYPACGFPHRSRLTEYLLVFCITLTCNTIIFTSSIQADECDQCDMGCTAGDQLDTRVGSDTLPGVMSNCGCPDCRSSRFENQFRSRVEHCEAYQPQWLAVGRGLAYSRTTQSAHVLISDSTNPIRQINRDSFKFGWEPGLDLSMRRIKWNENSFELRFMGLETLTAIATTTTGGSTELHSALPVFVSDITSIDATYQSELYGVEANWQFVTYCPFQYILGVRYIGLDEDLTANLQSPTAPVTYRTTTQNDLYGVQVGITSIPDMPLFDCQWLTWSAKFGLYGNDADQTSTLTGAVGQRADASADTAAFVGEFKIGLEFPLTRCLTLSCGYDVFLMERVAIATDQLQATNFFTGTGSDNEGNALFHGASIGATLSF